MKIIVAGAGNVGSHLARMLSDGRHEITVIDTDHKLLDELESVADLVTIEGDPSAFATLKRAAVRKADLFIAVSPNENMNIVAAMLAKQLGAKKSIARIDNNEYLEPDNKELFISMGIDYLFYPEKVAAREVVALLGHSSTTEYVDFSGGKLALIAFKLDNSSPMIGRMLKDAIKYDADMPYRAVAVSRGGRTIIPRGDDIFSEGDMAYVITTRESAREVMMHSGQKNVDIRTLMILGGSRIGVQVARELQDEVSVKLIEYNEDKAYRLAEVLDKTLIINDDGSDIEAMKEEGLSTTDAFLAVTERSETNILAAMLARKMGVKKVIAEVDNLNLINLAESIGIDTMINKKLITASSIFRFTMMTDVQAVKCLTGSEAQVLEFIAKPNSPVTKNRVKDLFFPRNALIGGVVRGDEVFIVIGDSQIRPYDRVVVFALSDAISKVGKFFN